MSISITFISLIILLVWLAILCRREAEDFKKKKIVLKRLIRNSHIPGQGIWY